MGQQSDQIDLDRISGLLQSNPNLGRKQIAKELGITEKRARRLLAMVKDGGESPAMDEITVERDPNFIHATSRSLKIKSLDELLAEIPPINREEWEIESHRIKKSWGYRKDRKADLKWSDGRITSGSVTDTGKMLVVPFWSIEVKFKRKNDQYRAAENLLKQIEAKAPLLPKVKPISRSAIKTPRSLEVCIVDPHVGLLCQYPEGDGQWDLDIAASTILTAIENLVQLATPFGPFTEVFMPFGNDFVHSDDVFHRTTAGTLQPEAISWHRVFDYAEQLSIKIVDRLRSIAPSIRIYEIPGNHSRVSDFALARVLRAYFHNEPSVYVDASSSPYKFHQAGVNIIGYEHGHSVSAVRLAGLMANECRDIWGQHEYAEWHLGDQHRKGQAVFEEQGVSIEYVPGITAPNEWHRLKAFNHQQRGAMAFVWDHKAGPLGRFQFNISKYTHKQLGK